MKTLVNTFRKSAGIALLIVFVLNLTACGSSNQVVSKRLIQKRKYTKGWFVKSLKPGKQARKEEFRTEAPSIEGSENTIRYKKPNLLKINRVKVVREKQKNPPSRRIVSTVFGTKVETNKADRKAQVNPTVSFNENYDEVTTIENTPSFCPQEQDRNTTRFRSSREAKHDIDPWFLALIILGGLFLVAVIVTIIIDSVALFNVLMIIATIVALVFICYIICVMVMGIGDAVESFFDLLF